MKKYISIDDMILSQEFKHQLIIKRVRDLLSVAHPKMKERFLFNTAMYECLDFLCYVGKIHQKNGVEISFVKGYLLSNEQGLLQQKGRKYTWGITFQSIADFNEKEEQFLEILQEAIWLNEGNSPKFWGLAFNKKNR